MAMLILTTRRGSIMLHHVSCLFWVCQHDIAGHFGESLFERAEIS